MSSVGAPLSSAAFFTPALFALQNSSNALAASTERLASGNRIINAGDDVAAFSIAAGLQSQLTRLTQASSNVAQGTSLLQVADGGLQQVSTILSGMQSIAIEANTNSLTTTQRAFLQLQLNSDISSINNIVSATTFNGINLIDGTLAGTNQLALQASSAPKASGALTFSSNVTAGQTIVLNGITLTEGVDFNASGTTALTIANIITALSASTNPALSQATYAASGTIGLAIIARTGGVLGNQYTIDQADSTAAFTTTGGATDVANKFTLTGGGDNGIHINSTTASGTVGDNVINTQSQTPANVTLTLSGAVSDGETLNIDNGHGGLVAFTFRTTASAATDIQIGSSTEQTLQNIVSTLSQYSGNDNYGVRQLAFAIDGNSLVISNRTTGNATETDGVTPLNISKVIANGTLSGASFNNGNTTGVNVSGITNSAFTGVIQGFTATYVAPDSITAHLTVGDVTYSANITDTTPGGNTTVRFNSSSGDYFDIQLAGGNGSTVNNPTDANNYAGRLNSAFAGLTFSQTRPVTDFSATNNFVGGSASLQLSNFSAAPTISNITVTAPASPGADGTINFTINGDTFQANTGLGDSLGANETIKFTNLSNNNQSLTLVNGGTVQDFSTANAASTLQAALRTAFDIGVNANGSNFQVGSNSTDIINVAIGSATTNTLFNGATLDVSTLTHAAATQTAITTASNILQGIIATVGALQSSFNFTANNLTQTITGIATANSNLSDTNIIDESTIFAQDTLRVNAGTAVIAQALALQPSLLKLLHSVGNS